MIEEVPDMVTSWGHGVWFDHPERTKVDLNDLEIHLSNSCRYVGAIDVPILMHLVLCIGIAREWGLSPDVIAYVAAHDLHEAYIPDIPTRLKPLVPGWKEREDRWEAWVHKSVGLEPPTPEVQALVKEVDLAALVTEMRGGGHPGEIVVRQLHARERLAELERKRPGWETGAKRVWRRMRDDTDWWLTVRDALKATHG